MVDTKAAAVVAVSISEAVMAAAVMAAMEADTLK